MLLFHMPDNYFGIQWVPAVSENNRIEDVKNKTDLDCEEHLICETLICQRLDEEETVPEKAKERVAVSEDVDPKST